MIVQTKNPGGVAAPVGAYSHLVIVPPGAQLLVLAGQVGMRPDGVLADTIEEQIALALDNIHAILASEGVGPDAVIKVNVWLAAPLPRAAFSAAWARFNDGHLPAMTLGYVNALYRPECLVEIEVWAARMVPVPEARS